MNDYTAQILALLKDADLNPDEAYQAVGQAFAAMSRAMMELRNSNTIELRSYGLYIGATTDAVMAELDAEETEIGTLH